MYIQEINNTTKKVSKLDKPFKNYLNGLESQDESVKNENGFFKLEQPTLLETQKNGNLIKIDNYYTYEVVDKNEDELKELAKVKFEQEMELGVVTDGFWFSLTTLGDFVGRISLSTQPFEWKNEAREWVFVEVNDAKVIAENAAVLFTAIYKKYS